MAYAGDRLFNEVIRRRMADLATKVKVREIIAYLSCLTISDREEIEAKRENAGNYTAMMLLLDNLRRRQNWPDEFISALHACEQWALADEISEAYDRIRGIHTERTAAAAASAPVPPAAAASVNPAACPAPAPAPTAAAPIPAPSPPEVLATVTTATVHSVPHSTPPFLTPSVEASPQSATLPTLSSFPGPYSNVAAPGLTEVPALVSAPDVPVHPPPGSSHPAEPPLSVSAPDARPPSPVSADALTPSIGQSEVPVGSRETSKQGISGASAPINSPPESYSNIASPALTEAPALVSALEASVQPPREPVYRVEPPLFAMPPSSVSAPMETPSVVQSEVPVVSRESPTLATSGGLTNIALSGPSSVAAPTLTPNPTSTSSSVNQPATTSQSSASPEQSKVPVQVIERPSSVKHPIQDTNPPGTVPARDSQNNPTVSQVVESVHTAMPNCQAQETSQGTAQASPSSSADCVAGRLSNVAAENEENFSKPGVLRGEEPFSVSSDHLQISHMTTERSPIQPARPQAVSNQHRAEEPDEETASVTTDDLMISSSTATVPSQCVSVPTAPVQNSTPTVLENGFPEGDSNLYPNQPVEDHYESFYQSLQREPGTRMHIVEVSEGPSVQNLEGQPPNMVAPTTIGLDHSGETESLDHSISEYQTSQLIQGISPCMQGNDATEQANPATASKPYAEPAPATFQESESNASGQINIPRSEQREGSQGVLHQFQSNLHLVAAAAIGLTAVFVALRHRC